MEWEKKSEDRTQKMYKNSFSSIARKSSMYVIVAHNRFQSIYLKLIFVWPVEGRKNNLLLRIWRAHFSTTMDHSGLAMDTTCYAKRIPIQRTRTKVDVSWHTIYWNNASFDFLFTYHKYSTSKKKFECRTLYNIVLIARIENIAT